MPADSKSAQPELRRSVTPWGSFSWGYSDVGADIFVGLGLVLAWAAGASNVAFLFAGVVYVCIGLAYTELAATYPVAGGGQYFVMRGLGDIFGFIAGWAVLARLHHRRNALCLDLRRLFQPAAARARELGSPVAALRRRTRARRRTLPFERHRRARKYDVQWRGIGARRDQRNLHPVLWLPFRVPAAAAHSHDANALAFALRADAGNLACDHLVRRSRIDFAGGARNATPGFDHSAHVGLFDSHDFDLCVGVLEPRLGLSTVASDHRCRRSSSSSFGKFSRTTPTIKARRSRSLRRRSHTTAPLPRSTSRSWAPSCCSFPRTRASSGVLESPTQ